MNPKLTPARTLVKLESLREQLMNEIIPLLAFTELDQKMLQTADLLAQDIQEFLDSNEFVIVNKEGQR